EHALCPLDIDYGVVVGVSGEVGSELICRLLGACAIHSNKFLGLFGVEGEVRDNENLPKLRVANLCDLPCHLLLSSPWAAMPPARNPMALFLAWHRPGTCAERSRTDGGLQRLLFPWGWPPGFRLAGFPMRPRIPRGVFRLLLSPSPCPSSFLLSVGRLCRPLRYVLARFVQRVFFLSIAEHCVAFRLGVT